MALGESGNGCGVAGAAGPAAQGGRYIYNGILLDGWDSIRWMIGALKKL